MMNQYKFKIVAVVSIIFLFFVFQNATCTHVQEYKNNTQSNQQSISQITQNAPLTLSPVTSTIITNSTVRLNTSGGNPPYTYNIAFGGGSISTAGIYTAPNYLTSTGILVTDSQGGQVSATVNVVAGTPSTLSFSANSYSISANTTLQFTTTGGTPPYSFLVLSGGGTIDSTGLYTAPSQATSAVVKVTDALSQFATRTITITAPSSVVLTTDPLAATISMKDISNFATGTWVTYANKSMCSVQNLKINFNLNIQTGTETNTNPAAYSVAILSDNSADLALSGYVAPFSYTAFNVNNGLNFSINSTRSISANYELPILMKLKLLSPSGRTRYYCLRINPIVDSGPTCKQTVKRIGNGQLSLFSMSQTNSTTDDCDSAL